MFHVRKLLVLAVGVVALAQEPIQVTTRLVQVAVVVRDKRGAVADLTKNDFEVFDKGKQRKIASFTVARASDHVPRASLPPNTFSNRLNQRSDSPVAVTVLLFDSLNTAFKDQADARRQILKLLKEIDPTSPVAIYALGNNLRVLHDFTEDHARLERALERYRSGTSTLLADSQPDPAVPSSRVSPAPADPGTVSVPDTADLVAQILEPLQNYSIERRVAITLSAMQLIADRMAGVPGRKNLIWISGGFPLTMAFDRRGIAGGGAAQVTYAGPMRDAAMAIDRANVAVYPVDARGLAVSSTIREDMPAPTNQAATGKTYSLPTAESMNNTREIDTMKLLADWTGGRAFYNSNDIRGAVARAMEDAEVTYTLGFYADEKDLDGTYHELKVRVSRKGADTNYRKGYFASPIVSVAAQSAVDILKSAVASPADSTGIGLTASLAPAPEPPGSFIVALSMDLQPLNLELRKGRWTDDLTFAIVQQGAAGLPLDSVSSTIHIDVTDENRDQLRKEGLTVKLRITPAPGLSQIRVAVMDQATGNVGSLRILPPRQP
jgi:VWFA-related protein